MTDGKRAVKQQFGANAEKYVSSSIHARGDSLKVLFDLVHPQPEWIVLDVATGGGHNASAFAKSCARIIAGDITRRIIVAARKHIHDLPAENISYLQFDAEVFPFSDNTLDCVTSRIAPHHFPSVVNFIGEAKRILRPGGVLAIADNVSPDNDHPAEYFNVFEKFRDPSHHWAYSVRDWRRIVEAAGLTIDTIESVSKDLDFLDWTVRTNASPPTAVRLKAMLAQAPSQVAKWLKPRVKDGRLVFSLEEAVIVARKPIS